VGGGDDLGPEPASELGAATEGGVDEEAVVIFRDNCGQCHTLSVAGTEGEIGPNLDEERYDRDRVLTAIERGGRGSGQMAPNLIEGAEAEQVADLIAGDEPLR
jgi:mono/diheme cytochrome c family protein